MRPKVERALHSVVNEWLEAPWFVILTIVATAFLLFPAVAAVSRVLSAVLPI